MLTKAGRSKLTTPRMLGEVLRLLRPFWPLVLFSTAMGAMSGLATASLLAAINRAMQADDGAGTALLLTLAGLCFVTLAGEIVSEIGNSLVGQRVIAALRRDLSAKILAAPIDAIERYRAHRILTALNQDVDMISAFSFNFSSLAVAFAITLGCLVYMVILSPLLFLVVAVTIVVGFGVLAVLRRQGLKGFTAAREAQDDLQRHYRSLIDGAKELRMNRPRRARVYEQHLTGAIGRIGDLKLRAMRIFSAANAFGSFLFFLAIALILALQGGIALDRGTISGFVIVLLYVRGPIMQLVSSQPMFGQAQVAFRRVADLAAQFAKREPHLSLSAALPPAMTVDSIELRGVTHAYPAPPGGLPFVLGPLDLMIRKGEIVFIVGGNGSGKTTLLKLLLGLYEPTEGELLLNGRPVTADWRDDYRQLFSTIFFDYYLFQDLILPDGLVPPETQDYLARLDLAHKVTIADGAFSTTDLSAGQRKRLALIQVYLEQRPVLVFDEWAAEQDPAFRRVFYEELLPDLKRQGKTLLVISHDDRYFGAADHVVKLGAGKLLEG